jgi:hypothetical protein
MKAKEIHFLETVLRLDALTCFGSGVASIALGPMLSGTLGLSPGLLSGSGIALLAVGAFILFAAAKTPGLRWPVWAVVLGNAGWVLASVLLLVSGVEQPTSFGTAYVIAQAVVVAILAELEYVGLRKTAALVPTAA